MKVIDDLLLQKKIGFHPHPAQIQILENRKRFTIISAGRRFGKSALCAYLVLRELLSSNKKIWVVSPTYELSRKVFNYLIPWANKYFPNTLDAKSDPHPIIKSLTGSIVEGKSADTPYSLMGEELDLVIIDEASAIPKLIWDQYIFPTLQIRNGRAILISTPKGQNWFYKIYKSELKFPELFKSFQFESRANPKFTQEMWELAEKTTPKDIFDQEYKAVFLSDAARVFRNIESCINGNFKPPQSGHIYVMGVDLGKKNDFTVITVIDLFDHHVVYWDRFNEIGWPLQKSRIEMVAEKYNGAEVYLDSTGLGDPIFEDLLDKGINVVDFKYSSESKSNVIRKLSVYIEQNRITYPDIPILLSELEDFGYNINSNGRYIFSAPDGSHDDCVNSLALAVWSLQDDKFDGPGGEIITFPTTDY